MGVLSTPSTVAVDSIVRPGRSLGLHSATSASSHTRFSSRAHHVVGMDTAMLGPSLPVPSPSADVCVRVDRSAASVAVMETALTRHFFFSKLGPSELRSIIEAMEGWRYLPSRELASEGAVAHTALAYDVAYPMTLQIQCAGAVCLVA